MDNVNNNELCCNICFANYYDALLSYNLSQNIKNICILNDKQTIIVQDIDENVSAWNVLKLFKTQSFGKVNFQNIINQKDY